MKIEFYLLILFVLFSAYFSGVEIAVYCINRVRLQYKVDRGKRRARIIQLLLGDPQALICTILIGNNIMNYIASAIFTGIVLRYLSQVNSELIATLILAPIMLVFAEVLPKDLCQRKADTFLYTVSPSLKFFSQIFYPLVYVLKGVNKIPQLLFKNLPRRALVFTPYRLGFFIREGVEEGIISSYQDMMARNIMELGSIQIKNVMIPLRRATLISHDISADQIMTLAKNVRVSRIPVYRDSPNNIVGLITLFDFLSSGTETSKVNDFLKDTEYLNAEMPIDEALIRMQKAKQRMAIVVNRVNKAIGIVTIKDLVEEIVGELIVW
ncbi:MAG: CNNM domain-containing protein [Candidatus Scalinduaceae bacterium]